MAENVNITPGSGDVIAADDIGGVKHQRVKISQGADGAATDVSSSAPLHVTLANTGANATAVKTDSSATTQPVSAASLPLPTGAATAAKQPALGTAGTPSSDVISVQGITSMTALTVDGSGVTQPVSASSLPLPTGAATSANQTTLIGHVDGIEGLLTTIDADTGALAGAVAGTEVQVDVVAALPAGTNAIGKLAANSGVDIGDVDVTSVTPGTTATALGKAEDAAHTSGDVGVMALGVRNDSMTDLTGTDGDYTPIATTSTGRAQVTRTAHANMVRGNNTVTTTSDTSLISAAGVGVKNYITAVQVSNSSSTNCVITLKDGSGGSTLGYIAAPANGGAVVYYDIPLVTTANTALFFASNNAATTIFMSAQGYKAA